MFNREHNIDKPKTLELFETPDKVNDVKQKIYKHKRNNEKEKLYTAKKYERDLTEDEKERIRLDSLFIDDKAHLIDMLDCKTEIALDGVISKRKKHTASQLLDNIKSIDKKLDKYENHIKDKTVHNTNDLLNRLGISEEDFDDFKEERKPDNILKDIAKVVGIDTERTNISYR